MSVHNFGAGPSILPQDVLQKSAQGILNLNNSGLSILEISHRSKDFIAIIDRAKYLVKTLMQVPDDYDILFLQGGASLQFLMVAINFLHHKAAYIDTGEWSSKAIQAAKGIQKEVIIVASSKDQNYSYIPQNISIPQGVDYVHITSNNTIYGTEFFTFPKISEALFCDMSSDIMSKDVKVSDFELIYAGVQKNIGPAGATLVIIKKSLLAKAIPNISPMLSYANHSSKESLYNTPPVFSIYTSMLNMEWLLAKGGVDWVEKQNIKKSKLLYEEIDRNSLFYGTVNPQNRSRMNVCFLLKDTILETDFLSLCNQNKLVGLKGHRSVGGFRASIYNALPIESVEILVSTMQNFEKKYK